MSYNIIEIVYHGLLISIIDNIVGKFVYISSEFKLKIIICILVNAIIIYNEYKIFIIINYFKYNFSLGKNFK